MYIFWWNIAPWWKKKISLNPNTNILMKHCPINSHWYWCFCLFLVTNWCFCLFLVTNWCFCLFLVTNWCFSCVSRAWRRKNSSISRWVGPFTRCPEVWENASRRRAARRELLYYSDLHCPPYCLLLSNYMSGKYCILCNV